jgi:hypothetical protein
MSGEPGAMSGQPRPENGEAPNLEPVAPPSTDATVVPADAGAIPAAEPTTGAAASDAASAPAGVIDTNTVAVPVRRPRRLAVMAGLIRVARLALALALLAVGVAIGYQSFITSQPAPTGPVADPATAGNQPAPVVREFIAAVGRNDADAIRSAVPTDPYKSLTAEMERWEIQLVTSVETLATFEDGQRTATAFVMIGRDNSNNPVAMNLIVETEAGQIVDFK